MRYESIICIYVYELHNVRYNYARFRADFNMIVYILPSSTRTVDRSLWGNCMPIDILQVFPDIESIYLSTWRLNCQATLLLRELLVYTIIARELEND